MPHGPDLRSKMVVLGSFFLTTYLSFEFKSYSSMYDKQGLNQVQIERRLGNVVLLSGASAE